MRFQLVSIKLGNCSVHGIVEKHRCCPYFAAKRIIAVKYDASFIKGAAAECLNKCAISYISN